MYRSGEGLRFDHVLAREDSHLKKIIHVYMNAGVPGGLVRRLSSCLLKSISRVQFSPSAHTRREFFSHNKNDHEFGSGKRESVS